MALAPRLDLRQVQTLVMTPQLQQAIKLLQLSNLELAEYLDQELEQNPLLQQENHSLKDGDQNENTDTPEENQAESPDTEINYDDFAETAPEPDSADLIGAEILSKEKQANLDPEYDDVWAQEDPSDTPLYRQEEELDWRVIGATASERDEFPIDISDASRKTLKDHLAAQVTLDIPETSDRIIANALIDLLDDSGYLHTPISEIANSLACNPQEVERVLQRIQAMDPAGIGARNLSECLAIQLLDRDRFDPAMQALTENLELLANRDFKTLLKVCGVDKEDLAQMIDEIRALDPKPGLIFEENLSEPIVPDVIVGRKKSGEWSVELNNDNLPNLLINNKYYNEVRTCAITKKDKEYISSCYQSATWLLKAVHQRAQTILKVSSEIVRHQEGFLEHGVNHLKPLILRDIAEIVGVHESTVSRVTTNKYMATPRGVFELKYFFTFVLGNSENSSALSVEAIRAKIKKMIDDEEPNKILSDDKIVSCLKGEGIEIARRTVAKYRESMKISSSVQRRREKKALLTTL